MKTFVFLDNWKDNTWTIHFNWFQLSCCYAIIKSAKMPPFDRGHNSNKQRLLGVTRLRHCHVTGFNVIQWAGARKVLLCSGVQLVNFNKHKNIWHFNESIYPWGFSHFPHRIACDVVADNIMSTVFRYLCHNAKLMMWRKLTFRIIFYKRLHRLVFFYGFCLAEQVKLFNVCTIFYFIFF